LVGAALEIERKLGIIGTSDFGTINTSAATTTTTTNTSTPNVPSNYIPQMPIPPPPQLKGIYIHSSSSSSSFVINF